MADNRETPEADVETVLANRRVSSEVKSWLGRRDLTQKDLAKVLGLSQGSLSFRMRGKTPWSIAELMKTAAWLEISLSQLLGDELLNEKKPLPTVKSEGASSASEKASVAGARFELATSGL